MSKENKRELILNALEELLPGRRFHEITLDEVAKAAQVGKGTIYLYFQDKDALFAELVCFRLAKLQNQLAELSGSSIEELPGKVFDLVGEFIRRHRNLRLKCAGIQYGKLLRFKRCHALGLF